jgi:hypothetical protein
VAKRAVDRLSLLERLEPLTLDEERSDEEIYLQRMSLSATLLTLAEIDHEREYQLCRSVAKHLLDHVHEPEELGFDDD